MSFPTPSPGWTRTGADWSLPAASYKLLSSEATNQLALLGVHETEAITPEPVTAQLLAHLGLCLPKGARLIAAVVPKYAT